MVELERVEQYRLSGSKSTRYGLGDFSVNQFVHQTDFFMKFGTIYSDVALYFSNISA